jgi:pseudolysin
MKCKLIFSLTSLLIANVANAATAIDLHRQPAVYLQKYLAQKGLVSNTTTVEPIRTYQDFKQTMHTRLQQKYAGIPVWNATAVLHTPKGNSSSSALAINSTSTMNGTVYEGIEKDLANTPPYALSDAQKNRGLEEAKATFQKKMKTKVSTYEKQTVETIVFVNDKKQARHAYLVTLLTDDGKTGAHRPTFIIDATTLEIYRQWDRIYSAQNNPNIVIVGGIGGNEKAPIIYDGGQNNLPRLPMLHRIWDKGGYQSNVCSFENNDVVVKDVSYDMTPVTLCDPSEAHDGMLWVSHDVNQTRWKEDEVNGGFSPSLDALHAGIIVKKLYQDWYGVPVLTESDGKTPLKLLMRVHYGRNFENAFWDGEKMTFGDGGKMFYPLASLDVGAHEISHGFTEQNSHLDGWKDQMAALHEAFSDMSSVAARYYAQGSATYDIGRNIMKGDAPLRYMQNPTYDGQSIDHMKDYQGEWSLEPHLLAGVFNKAFYLIATSHGWDIHKAFNIMVKANMNYWTSSMTTFSEAACGVVWATNDYGYNVADVRLAFYKVGIETGQC